MQGQGVGNIDEIVKATLVKKSMHIEDEFKEMHSLSSTTDRLNEAREKVSSVWVGWRGGRREVGVWDGK